MDTTRIRALAGITHDRDVDPETGAAIETTIEIGDEWDCPASFAAQLIATGAAEAVAPKKAATRARK